MYDFGNGIAGRQLPGHPLPDHGKQGKQMESSIGGNYCNIHPQYYKDTGINPHDTRAPEFPNVDILEMVLPAAHKRGIKVYTWADDQIRRDLPNVDRIQEVDLHGRPVRRGCYNNPYYQNYLLGMTEDYMRSHDVDGVMWCMEANGALENALSYDPISCFCQHCQEKARKQGIINLDRTRKGLEVLSEFQSSCRAGTQPVDGHYVTFWRILMRNPEILAWEHFWHEGLRDIYKMIYAKVKSIESQHALRLAHRAFEHLQPFLQGGTRHQGDGAVHRHPERGDVPQLRGRAHGARVHQPDPARRIRR